MIIYGIDYIMNNIAITNNYLDRADNLELLTDRFIASQDVGGSSKDTYRKTIRQFILWSKDCQIIYPEREDILAYKEYLKEKDLSALTLSSYLVAVRKFFEWTEGIKLYPNIARGIKGSKQSRNFKKDPLTIEQVKELLSSIDRSGIKGLRDFAIINLLIRTGLRTIEVIRADIEDIRQESGEAVLWVRGKGRDSKDEFVLLTESTLKPIKEYLNIRNTRGGKKPLFVSLSDRNKNSRLTTRSLSRIVKNSLRKIGLNDNRLTAHSLRHTAITLALKGGATIQEAQALGRHANINTTLIYSHNINRVAQAPEKKIDMILDDVAGSKNNLKNPFYF